MMITKKKLPIAFIGIATILPLCSQAMKQPQMTDPFHAIMMPGQNGMGGECFSRCGVINSAKTNFQTLQDNIDFGQQNCIRDFDRQHRDLQTKYSDKHKTFHCVSQGTATVLNWLSQKSRDEQNNTAKLVVLEGVLGNGNNAIMHTVGNIPLVTYIPFARVWMPLLAKLLFFPSYNPFGMQAIKSAPKISPNIPVVIMHNEGDPQTPINDARELYCALKENREKEDKDNIYLIETNNGYAHFNILDRWNLEQQQDLQAVYRKHNLPVSISHEISKKNEEQIKQEYQPSIEEVKTRIAKTNGYKSILRNIIDASAAALIIAGLWWKYRK